MRRTAVLLAALLAGGAACGSKPSPGRPTPATSASLATPPSSSTAAPAAGPGAAFIALIAAEKDIDLRHNAGVRGLLLLGDRAGPDLRRALHDPEPRMRQASLAALRLLQGLPGDTSWTRDLLKEALHSDDEEVRAGAADALGFAGLMKHPPPPEATALLLAALGDSAPRVRATAAVALVRLGGDASTEIVAALIEGLGPERASLNYDAADALGRLGRGAAAAIPALRKVLERAKANEYAGDQAAEALNHLGEPGAEALLAVLGGGDRVVRARVFRAVVRRGALREKAVPALLDGLREPDETVREAAAGALGAVDLGSPPVVSALMAAMEDPNHSVSQAALRALAAEGPAAKAAIPKLQSLLAQDRERDLAARALGSMGPLAIPAAGALRRVIAKAPEAITTALARLGKEGLPALAEALAHVDPEVRRYAARALEKGGSDAVPAVRPLVTALSDRDPLVRNFAAQALGAIGPGAVAALPALVMRLEQDEDPNVRSWSAAALGHLGSRAAVPALEKALAVEGAEKHAEAARALAQLGVVDASLPTMIDAACEGDTEVLATLEALGPRAAAAVPLLQANLAAFSAPTTKSLVLADLLGHLDPGSAVAFAHLERALADVELGVGAAVRLAWLGRASDQVLALLRAAQLDGRTRAAAAIALLHARPGDPETTARFRELLDSDDDEPRGEAAGVFAEAGAVPADAVAVLQAMLRDRYERSREHAAKALGLLGPTAQGAVPELRRLFIDENPRVRSAAKAAVRAIESKGAP